MEDAQVDHVVPFAEGGLTEPSNAQLLHAYCNRHKSNKVQLDAPRSQSRQHGAGFHGNGFVNN